MADLTELKNIVRKGIVQSVDAAGMKARVKFGDKGGIVSGELHILTSNHPIDEKKVEGHMHSVSLEPWIPSIGSMVLCIMIPDGDGEGYIAGEIR